MQIYLINRSNIKEIIIESVLEKLKLRLGDYLARNNINAQIIISIRYINAQSVIERTN